MIKALIYGDVQATEGSERCFSNPAVPLQRYRVDLFYSKLFELYTELGCNAVWDLGDTTDDRTAIPIPALNSVIAGISRFPASPYNIKITGNHEQYTRNAEIDNGCLFRHSFNVVNGIRVFDMEHVALIACSYPASQTNAATELQSLLLKRRKKRTIVLGHLDIAGTKLKSGVSLAGFPAELFNDASLVLLGHIHLPQQISKNIHYVGSPFQQDFGETGETKRVGLLTIDSNNINLEWITLGGFPEYRYVSYAEFTQLFSKESEDRYSVSIKSPQEAELFYAHEYSDRAQIEYAYEVMGARLDETTRRPTDWSLAAAAERWVMAHAPSTKGLEINEDELLQFGLSIAETDLTR